VYFGRAARDGDLTAFAAPPGDTSPEKSGRAGVADDLAYLAMHDGLTGLPNRSHFLTRLAQALSRRDDGIHVVLFIDLDNFKKVNDGLGHRVGDALLVAVGQRLRSCLRSTDIASRFGGDEFVMLVEECRPDVDPLDIAGRFVDVLRRPFTVERHTVAVTASIGVAVGKTPYSWPTELLKNADIALHRAKLAGRARAVLFDPSMTIHTAERLELEEDLGHAVERGELYLEYQPEVNLSTGAIVGVEALLRWQHPRRGQLQAADIIPLAEDTGLILPIGNWVLGETCRQARAWRALPTTRPFAASVNVSARQFDQSGLAEEVVRALGAAGLDPSELRLEITEGVLMRDAQSSRRTLEALKQLGVGLAIDDFGTGYSSLAYLRQFPLDVLKLDQSFVRELDTEEKTVAIVQAILTLAHALDMQVTAEGVETSSQATRLRDLGCDRGQGYFFGKPQRGDLLAEVLRAGTW